MMFPRSTPRLDVLTGALAPGDADFAKRRREDIERKEP